MKTPVIDLSSVKQPSTTKTFSFNNSEPIIQPEVSIEKPKKNILKSKSKINEPKPVTIAEIVPAAADGTILPKRGRGRPPIVKTQEQIDNEKLEKENKVHKRRGRKSEKIDDYIQKGNIKIQIIKEALKTAKQDGITVAERKKMRCKVSAHEHRIKKK